MVIVVVETLQNVSEHTMGKGTNTMTGFEQIYVMFYECHISKVYLDRLRNILKYLPQLLGYMRRPSDLCRKYLIYFNISLKLETFGLLT